MIAKNLPQRKRVKRKHSRRNRTQQKHRMELGLDAICRAEVFERDGNVCQRCGAAISCDGTPLQWSHVHSRRHNCLRWDPDNSKVLCKGCHFWWGNNPGLAIDWFQKNWPERWRRITDLLILNPKTDVRGLWEARCQQP